MSDRRLLLLDLLTLACSLATGVVFLYASLDKIQHPAAFAQAIANYRMVPMPLLHTFAWLLPVAEAVVGIALIVGWQRRGAALLASLMTVMFIIAIASALSRGLDISCGCFDTAAGGSVGLDLLLRDILLLAAALVPLLMARDRWTLDALLRRPRGSESGH
jgi:putative oxidoreductase